MKFIRALTAVFLVFCCVFTAVYGKNKISGEKENMPAEYKGIISVWQVDSFEGGTGSRKQFLLKVAREFERKNPGVLVMVTNYTADGVEENQTNGISPDIISFGGGTDVKEFSALNIDVEFTGGKMGNKDYAVPWCRGGYVLISNPKLTDGKDSVIENLLVSKAEYTQPLVAVLQEELSVKELTVKSPMDAYVQFVSGKTPYFLATQRDLMRLKNRGMEVDIRPLEKFNDLIQYAVITSTQEIKRYYAEEFLRFLMSEKIQEKVYDIGMFSVVCSAKIDDMNGQLMQKVKGFSTISPFTEPVVLEQMNILANKGIFGDETSTNKIKNMLVLP